MFLSPRQPVGAAVRPGAGFARFSALAASAHAALAGRRVEAGGGEDLLSACRLAGALLEVGELDGADDFTDQSGDHGDGDPGAGRSLPAIGASVRSAGGEIRRGRCLRCHPLSFVVYGGQPALAPSCAARSVAISVTAAVTK